MKDEPDPDCYLMNFSIPPKGPCLKCKDYAKCKEIFDLEVEDEEYGEEEGLSET